MKDELERRLLGDGATVAGVLSGTSADGISVALAMFHASRTDGRLELAPPRLACFDTVEFPRELRPRLRHVLDGGAVTLREIALLHRDLGQAFGRAARTLADRQGLVLDLVGSHGQTVWHHDGTEPAGRATLQLGDADFVAEECGCAVVGDFRQRDVAAGGEGAPISALADDLILAHVPRPCALLNLGGIANVTILLDRPQETIAFDTGPANSILDGLSRHLLGRDFDDGGEIASRGQPNHAVVERLMLHPFLAKAPPKSTGRDTFGAAWVQAFLEMHARSLDLRSARHQADVLATAAEFVAASVADALHRFSPVPIRVLYVAGGGVRNRHLVSAIERRSRVPCLPSDAVGLSAEAREGLVFAVLAVRCALEIPVTSAITTGARQGRVLGKLSAPARLIRS
jgi:anhydro-N-acetylmuramic acid kinase